MKTPTFDPTKAIIIWTTAGIKAQVRSSNKPYVVVNRKIGKVVASSDSSLIGEEWPLPSAPPSKAGSATIPPPPLPLLIALSRKKPGEAWFTHETAYMVLPAGARIVAEIVPPSPDVVHYNWAMTFGDLVDPSVVITHSHATQMKEHEDPLYFSIVNFVYPLNLKVEQTIPHILDVYNGAPGDRQVEATLWIVEATLRGADYIDNMFRGMDNLLTALGRVSAEDIRRLLAPLAPPAPPPALPTEGS